VLQKIIAPYTRVTLPALAEELNINTKEVEELIISLILDNTINAKIDEIKQELVIIGTGGATSVKTEKTGKSVQSQQPVQKDAYDALLKWQHQLSLIHQNIVTKV
jgi:hypothetical protein